MTPEDKLVPKEVKDRLNNICGEEVSSNDHFPTQDDVEAKKREHWGEEYDTLVEKGVRIFKPLSREEFCDMAIEGGLAFLEKDGEEEYLNFKGEIES